jgi:hypothetical protein
LERLSADLDGRQLDLCRLVQAPRAPRRPGRAVGNTAQHHKETMMSDTEKMVATLVADFISVAQHRQASPVQAAAALMCAASMILVADFGEVAAIEMMHSILDESSAQWVASSVAGSC